MDFSREWTQFALDAEVEHVGTARIAKVHNALRAKILRLEQSIRDALEYSGGRESEWGERAEECFRILERGIESA